jgi:hypothetical protein
MRAKSVGHAEGEGPRVIVVVLLAGLVTAGVRRAAPRHGQPSDQPQRPTRWNDREGPGLYGGYLQVATDQRERRAASSRMLAMAKEARRILAHARSGSTALRAFSMPGATNALQRRTTATIYVASAEAAEASGRMQKNSAS